LSDEKRNKLLSSVPDVTKLMFSMFSGQLAKKKHELPMYGKNYEIPRFNELPMFYGEKSTLELKHAEIEDNEEDEEVFDEDEFEDEDEEVEDGEYTYEEELFDDSECDDETGFCYAKNY